MAFATPTGKAAQVLTAMGNKNAFTIHRLLYKWFPTNEDGSGFRRKRISPLQYKLVICDEVSMIDLEMINELLSHHECHIIFVGDPFQLPSVSKESGEYLLKEPHVFLSEIMRQELESDIIRLSMEVREGKSLSRFIGKDAQVIGKNDVIDGMLTWADQVICAKNDTRKAFNQKINALKGFSNETVQDGQKIIFLRNYWEEISEEGEPVVNGTIGFLDDVKFVRRRIAPRAGGGYIDCVKCNVITENQDIYYDMYLDFNQLLTGERTITDPKILYKINSFYKSKWAKGHELVNPIPMEAELGWAITCHKAQGSTFEKVFVLEENFPFEREEHQRWVYTAATRPSSRLVLVQK